MVTPLRNRLLAADGPFNRQVRLLGLCFAAALFVLASIVYWGLGFNPLTSAGYKLIGIAGDAVLAAILTLILWGMRGRSLGARALVACVLSLGLSPVSFGVDHLLHIWAVWPEPAMIDRNYMGQVILFTTSELFGWSCLYLALEYSTETRAAEQRLVIAQQEALSAQMRALQFQVNPHFLFNTLNSIVGLVEEAAPDRAVAMVHGLADFLRATLQLDPMQDITLAQELGLQGDYLKIEQIRFEDRLAISITVEPDVEKAKVPPLILQPLVENAIKHGVSRVSGPQQISIHARKTAEGQLQVDVENAVPANTLPAPIGLGVGLVNVHGRLQVRFPGLASCTEHAPTHGRKRVTIQMPLVT